MLSLKILSPFVSHSSVDKPKIRPLLDDLTRAGIRPWLDENELMGAGGLRLHHIIREAIQFGNSPCILLFLSKRSIKSDWVEKEINWILDVKDRGARIIPVLLEPYTTLELTETAKRVLESPRGERTTLYYEYKESNHDEIVTKIVKSIFQHYGISESTQIVFHAGHRLPLEKIQVPEEWKNHPVLDFRTYRKDGPPDDTPHTTEWKKIKRGLFRVRSALPRLEEIYLCGFASVGFAACLSHVWGRGSGLRLYCWNQQQSEIWSAEYKAISIDRVVNNALFEIKDHTRASPLENREEVTLFFGWQEHIFNEVKNCFGVSSRLVWIKTGQQWSMPLDDLVNQIVSYIGFIAQNSRHIKLIFGLPFGLVGLITWNLRALGSIRVYDYLREGKKYVEVVQLQ